MRIFKTFNPTDYAKKAAI